MSTRTRSSRRSERTAASRSEGPLRVTRTGLSGGHHPDLLLAALAWTPARRAQPECAGTWPVLAGAGIGEAAHKEVSGAGGDADRTHRVGRVPEVHCALTRGQHHVVAADPFRTRPVVAVEDVDGARGMVLNDDPGRGRTASREEPNRRDQRSSRAQRLGHLAPATWATLRPQLDIR